MNRRTFLGLSAAAALTGTCLGTPLAANKRERMLSWLAGQNVPDCTPAAFFLHFGESYKIDLAAAKKSFQTPLYGWHGRHGMIGSGTPTQVETEIRRIVKGSPTSFILGADCTVEANTDWDRLKQAISVAHRVSVA